jgi:hypothetical protein
MKSLGYQSVHSSEKSDSQFLCATGKHTTKKEDWDSPGESEGRCVRAFSAGAHFLCGQNFGNPIRLAASALAPAASNRGTSRTTDANCPSFNARDFTFAANVSSFPVVSLPFVSVLFHSRPEGRVDVAAHVSECIDVWRLSPCALTAFLNDTSRRHLSNKSKEDSTIQRRELDTVGSYEIRLERLDSRSRCDAQSIRTTASPYKSSIVSTSPPQAVASRRTLECGRCIHRALRVQPCQILYATAASGGSRLAPKVPARFCRSRRCLNWRAPKFQSKTLPHSYALSPRAAFFETLRHE